MSSPPVNNNGGNGGVGDVSVIQTGAFHGYQVTFSPYTSTKLAFVGANNYGLAGAWVWVAMNICVHKPLFSTLYVATLGAGEVHIEILGGNREKGSPYCLPILCQAIGRGALPIASQYYATFAYSVFRFVSIPSPSPESGGKKV